MRRRKSDGPKEITEILPGVIGSLDKKIMKEERLAQIWQCSADPEIAKHTRPMSLKNGQLFVTVENSSWAHRAGMARYEAIKRLNEMLDGEKVTGINFKIGRIEEE